MWQCRGDSPRFTFVYVIGAIDQVSDLPAEVSPDLDEERVVHLAVLGVAESEEPVLLKLDHLPMRGATLGCRGQTHYEEGGVLPGGFGGLYDAWHAQLAETGRLVWHDRPVDEVVLETAGLEPR